ncbi:MAG: hypothetical protein PHG48_08975 [Eubacteriales bacterium]|nr:hypothetical protein [Eubacteriales bacterium]
MVINCGDGFGKSSALITKEYGCAILMNRFAENAMNVKDTVPDRQLKETVGVYI